MARSQPWGPEAHQLLRRAGTPHVPDDFGQGPKKQGELGDGGWFELL